MKRIRLGNTIDIVWEIFLGKDKDKGKYDLTGKKLTIYLVSAFDRIKISDFTTEFNVLRFTFEGKDQKHAGRYQLTFVENEGGDDTRTLDKCDAFELVKGSCKETDDLSEITLASSFDALRIYPIIPQVGPNRNWWVDGVDTGKSSVGLTAYEFAKEQGYEGTEEEYAAECLAVPVLNEESREATEAAIKATEAATIAAKSATDAAENANNASEEASTSASKADTAAASANEAAEKANEAAEKAEEAIETFGAHNIGSIDLFEQIIAQKQNHDLTLEDKEAILSGKIITTSVGEAVVPTISITSIEGLGLMLMFRFNERLYSMCVMWNNDSCYINGFFSFSRDAKFFADSELSETSENAVQNKVVTEKLAELDATKLEGEKVGTTEPTEDFEISAEIEAKLDELSAKTDKIQDNYAVLDGLTKAETKNIIGNIQNGYYRKSDGVFVSTTGYVASEPSMVIPNEIVKVNTWVTSGVVASVIFFDKLMNPLMDSIQGTSEIGEKSIVVPNDAFYAALSCVDSASITPTIYAERASLNAYNKEEVDTKINHLEGMTLTNEESVAVVQTYDYTQDGSNGFWKTDKGDFYVDDSRRCTQKIAVAEGETYLITTHIRPASIAAMSLYDASGAYIGTWKKGAGVDEYLADEPYVVAKEVTTIAVNSVDKVSPIVKKVVQEQVFAAYTKTESNEKFERKGGSVGKFGLSWSLTDNEDLGSRCFASVGMNAEIAIGNEGGKSDFDTIYPWSEMKRCNIRVTDNGAKVVVYEGEDGFALDGSNGDVYVRIPKFKTNRYTQDGRMYVVIGEGYTHPLFIENGVELDEVFVGAYEASKEDNALYSKIGVIPANNMVGNDFLNAAKARGNGYTLFDMRATDALWRLMAVEYGCRNSNRILGYGYSDYRQAAEKYSYLFAKVAASSTNKVTLPAPNDNSLRAIFMTEFAIGNNILFCEGNQNNILAQRKITNIVCASSADDIVITFDGTPIDITTSTFVGNAPCDCGYCDIAWHTGRTDRQPMVNSRKPVEAINPCRYRWIENPIGNVWHFLPDVLFVDGQMYVCDNIEKYSLDLNLDNYTPIGDILPLQQTNGNKNDVNTSATPNYWMTKMMNDTFAKGSAFGKAYDTEHNGLLSTMGFGGYYYLNSGSKLVVHGGGFDHLYRSNVLTYRAQIAVNQRWFLYGARLMFKNL